MSIVVIVSDGCWWHSLFVIDKSMTISNLGLLNLYGFQTVVTVHAVLLGVITTHAVAGMMDRANDYNKLMLHCCAYCNRYIDYFPGACFAFIRVPTRVHIEIFTLFILSIC